MIIDCHELESHWWFKTHLEKNNKIYRIITDVRNISGTVANPFIHVFPRNGMHKDLYPFYGKTFIVSYTTTAVYSILYGAAMGHRTTIYVNENLDER